MSTGYRRWDGGWPPASNCGHQHRRIRIADHCSQLVRYFRLETAENHDNGVTRSTLTAGETEARLREDQK